MKNPEKQILSNGGCCVTDAETMRSENKNIIVYPYTDPSVPFAELSPEQITFYLHVTNKTGKPETQFLFRGNDKSTCKANCSGCYFQTLPPYQIDLEIAQKISNDFRLQGYDIGLITADSFSNIALDLQEAGSAFRYNITKQNGNAWTSGNLLFDKNEAEKRLNLGWEMGYGVITISLYGVVLEHPMKSTPKPKVICRAIQNIQEWNKEKFPNGEGGYDIITTQLVTCKNCNIEDLRKVAQWCLDNDIRICRFNSFANFLDQDEMEEYEMTVEDTRKFWQILAQLQNEFIDQPIQFAVSEDMSAAGIETCIPYFKESDGWDKFSAENPYWCRAGYRLFSINAVQNKISRQVDLIITACVDNWNKLPIGKVRIDDNGSYYPDFNIAIIEQLRNAIVNKTISTCWGGVGNPRGKNPRGFIPSEENERFLFGELKK